MSDLNDKHINIIQTMRVNQIPFTTGRSIFLIITIMIQLLQMKENFLGLAHEYPMNILLIS